MDEFQTPRPTGAPRGTAAAGTSGGSTQGPEITAAGRGNALPAGFQLGSFRIEGVVGVGGFGIVYRARDLVLERDVAIKEYMPGVLAERTADFRITVRSAEDRDTFVTGLRSFVNEARLLARFSHSALVSVLSYWEDHGTAYMVMPFYQGQTLKQVLHQQPRPGEAWIRKVFLPILDVLEMLHGEQCLHRDVAPDNILMLAGERPLLLDLGAARQVVGEATQAFTAILKPAYAPMEQYSSDGRMRQGPWTDVYASAAVLHWMVTGQPPPTAMQRVANDGLPLLDALPAGRYRQEFLDGIRAGLGLRPDERPQDIASLRRLLFEEPASALPSAPAPAAAVAATGAPAAAPAAALAAASVSAPAAVAPAAANPAAAAPAMTGWPTAAGALDDPDRTVVVTTATATATATAAGAGAAEAAAGAAGIAQADGVAMTGATPSSARRGAPVALAVGVLLALAGSAAWWWHQAGQQRPETPAQAPSGAVTAVPTAPAATAPAVAAPAATAPAAAAPAATTPAATPPAATAPAATATVPIAAIAPEPVAAARAPASAAVDAAQPQASAPARPAGDRPHRPSVRVAGNPAAAADREGGATPARKDATPASQECREAEMNVALGNDGPDDLARLRAVCGKANPH